MENLSYKANPYLHISIEELKDIDTNLLEILKNNNIVTIDQILNLTIEELIMLTLLSEDKCKEIFFAVDFFLDNNISPRPLCSNLPSKFYPVSIDFLDLSLNAYMCLKEATINTFGELAQMTGDKLASLKDMSNVLGLEVEFTLSKFIDNYRSGTIEIV